MIKEKYVELIKSEFELIKYLSGRVSELIKENFELKEKLSNMELLTKALKSKLQNNI